MADSSAPSSVAPPRRPAVPPRRLELGVLAAKLVRDWTKKRRVSERDLAGVLEVSKKVADEMLVAEKHFAFRDVLALPDRDALDLLDELRLLILSRRSHG